MANTIHFTMEESSQMVNIRRQWNDWREATVPLSKLSGIHWSRISGGVRAKAPQPFIHAYIWCNEIQGDFGHSCIHGSGPHPIKVCIVKSANSKEVFDLLLRSAGPKP